MIFNKLYMSLEVDINVLTFFVIKLQYNVYNYDILVNEKVIFYSKTIDKARKKYYNN